MIDASPVRSRTRRNRALKQVEEIEHLQLDQFKIGKVQVRKHSDKNLTALAQSIAEFGFTVPAIVDDNNELISGHGRILAAKRLGLETIPCFRASHLNPEQISAYRIAENRLAELSKWDEATLRIELGSLVDLSIKGTLDFSPTITGFEVAEIDVKIGLSTDEPEIETVEEPPRPKRRSVN